MYYFKKTRSEVVKEIFSWLLLGGIICIAATSPYFLVNILKSGKRFKKYQKKRVYDTFHRLQKEGCIIIKEKNNQIHISLTEKGRKKAGYLQVDSLRIKKPKKWDGKWRIAMFDIAQLKKFYREAFRGKIKDLGFLPLQKSVWICPFECKKEINILKSFFGFTDKEMILVIADDIGDDSHFRKIFKINNKYRYLE